MALSLPRFGRLLLSIAALQVAACSGSSEDAGIPASGDTGGRAGSAANTGGAAGTSSGANAGTGASASTAADSGRGASSGGSANSGSGTGGPGASTDGQGPGGASGGGSAGSPDAALGTAGNGGTTGSSGAGSSDSSVGSTGARFVEAGAGIGDAARANDGAAAHDAGASTGKPTLFYLDVGGRVMTADANTPMARVLVSKAGSGPDGIALDLAGGHIFWTNMGVPADNDGYVRRANLDGTNMITVVPAGGTWTPKQLRLDPSSGKLYWSDREGMRIQRANLDGSDLESLVITGTGDTARADASNWCVGMALDVAGGWFYWTQKGPTKGGVGSIRRAHIQMPAGDTAADRSDIEILYAGLPEPIDIELDLDAGQIYWADRGDNTINRGPIAIPSGSTAATRTDRQILVPSANQAIGVTIDKARGRLYYTTADGHLGRANLDGSGNQVTAASASTGIVVVDR